MQIYGCSITPIHSVLSETVFEEVDELECDVGEGECYAQALGVVVKGSLSVELLGRTKTHSGRPSCRATQGQNHGIRRGCGGSGEVRQSV